MTHRFSICSYSFRHTFARAEMDFKGYVAFHAQHGFSQLDPWMQHIEPVLSDRGWLNDAKRMADDEGLPYGCIAVDGAHMYEESASELEKCRDMASRWLEAAEALGASQLRIDSGGPEELTDEIFAIIVDGYTELIPKAQDAGVEILVENHWGPTKYAENTVRLLEEVEGLGLLFDTNNWAEGTHEEAWNRCAKYARLTHFKTFSFDQNGNDPSVDLHQALSILRESGYDGVWGIESTPIDGDELGAVLKTRDLIQRALGGS